MSALFLSYARADRRKVESLAADLREAGHGAWFDAELIGGTPWWQHILQKIRESDVFIFVASKDSAKSLACRRELQYALDLRLPIIPVAVQPIVEIGALPPRIEELHIVAYADATKAEALKLARALAELPPREPLPTPLPKPPLPPITQLTLLQHRAMDEAAMGQRAQSDWLSRLQRELDRGAPLAHARSALEHLLRRRDLGMMTMQEARLLLTRCRSAPPSPASGQAPTALELLPTIGATPLFPDFARLTNTSSVPGFMYDLGTKLKYCAVVTPLPVVGYGIASALGWRRGFWISDPVISVWSSFAQTFPAFLTTTLSWGLVLGVAWAIWALTRKIGDLVTCVSARDHWNTSFFGVGLALFLALSVSGVLGEHVGGLHPQVLIGGACLVHLAAQWYEIAFHW